MEESVHPKGQLGPDPVQGPELVGAGPQMRDGPQVLVGMAFLLQRVARIRLAEDFQAAHLELPLLSLAGGFHQRALKADGRARVDPFELVEPFGPRVDDGLQVLQAGPVVDLQKNELLALPLGPDPTLDHQGRHFRLGQQNVGHSDILHFFLGC